MVLEEMYALNNRDKDTCMISCRVAASKFPTFQRPRRSEA